MRERLRLKPRAGLLEQRWSPASSVSFSRDTDNCMCGIQVGPSVSPRWDLGTRRTDVNVVCLLWCERTSFCLWPRSLLSLISVHETEQVDLLIYSIVKSRPVNMPLRNGSLQSPRGFSCGCGLRHSTFQTGSDRVIVPRSELSLWKAWKNAWNIGKRLEERHCSLSY